MPIDQSIRSGYLDDMPVEVHWRICLYLTPYEILTKLKPLSKYFRRTVASTMFWTYINRIRPLSLLEKYMRTACLVERRSKGKLF